MDGVIIDHTENKILVAKELGFEITPEQTPSEVLKKYIPDPEYRRLQNIIFGDIGRIKQPPLMPGVNGVLEKLRTSEMKIFLVSRRKITENAIALLKNHELWPKYFNKSNTFFVKEIEDKETEAKKLGITHYIDDENRVLAALTSVPNKRLFDQHNVFHDSEFSRLTKWEEAEEFLFS